MKQIYIFGVVLLVSVLSLGKSNIADIVLTIGTFGLAVVTLISKKNEISVQNKVLLGLVFLYLWALSFSVRQSVSFLTSYQVWIYLGLVYFFAFMASTYLSSSVALGRIVTGLLYFSGIVSLLTLLYYIFGIKLPQGDLSLFFPTYGHNRFAEFFLPFVPFAVSVIANRKTPKTLRVFTVISLINIAASFSRATLVGLSLLPFITVVLRLKFTQVTKKWLWLTGAGATTLFLGLSPVWLNSPGFDPKAHPLRYIFDKPFTAKDRLVFFVDSIKGWENKKIFGYGPGTYQYTPPNLWSDKTATIYVHNHLLQSLYENGLLGLSVEIVLLVFIFVRARQNCRTNTDGLLFAGVCLSLVQAQLDFGWEIPAVFLINLILLLSLGSRRLPSSQTQPSRLPFVASLYSLILVLLFFGGPFWLPSAHRFQKQILRSQAEGDHKQVESTISKWLSLDRENGSTYKWLFHFSLAQGDLERAFEYLKSLSQTVYQKDELRPGDLTDFLEQVAKHPESLSLTDRYELLDQIDRNFIPNNFFWLVNSQQEAVFSIIDQIISSSSGTPLENYQLAKISYWKYTQLLVSGSKKYPDYTLFIDRARELDSGNELYEKIYRVHQSLISSNESELQKTSRSLPDAGKENIPPVLLGLADHIYMRLGELAIVSGDWDKEERYRRQALSGTQTAIAFLELARRYDQRGQKSDFETVIADCARLYPDCPDWYRAADNTTLK